jgi:hypothetical protein
MPKGPSRTICGAVALMGLVALPMKAGIGQSAGASRVAASDTAIASPRVAVILSAADQANNCAREYLLQAIQSDMKVAEVAKRLLKPLATSPDQACKALYLTIEGEAKTIHSLQAHAASCGLRPRDLDPIIADHQDTMRVMYRVCSPAQIRQSGIGENRFEDFGMPPLPE